MKSIQILTILSLCSLTAAESSETVTVAESTLQSPGSSANNSIYWGQSFVPTDTGSIESISVYASDWGVFSVPEEITLFFYEMSGGVVSTPSLYSVTVSPSDSGIVENSSGWLSIPMSESQVNLVEGNSYAFVIGYDTSNPENSNGNFLSFQTTEGYTDGSIYWSFDQGTTVSKRTGNKSLHFKVEANAGSPCLSISNAIQLSFTAHSGFQYQIQKSSSLEPENWVNDGEPINGDDSQIEEFRSINDEQKFFYRVTSTPNE